MKQKSTIMQPKPLNIVGSSVFGRYNKISIEETFNMFISDGALVPFAGHKLTSRVQPDSEGRGIFASTKFNHIIFVIGTGVYTFSTNNGVSQVGTMLTGSGDVFISENDNNQIAIVDGINIYVFNYSNFSFQMNTAPPTPNPQMDFNPTYIDFQDSYSIATDEVMNEWRLSDPNDSLSWPSNAQNTGEFQTEANVIQAVKRFPSKGNLLLVLGTVITEPWYDIPSFQLFPYQKNTFFNIDYGTVNKATLDAMDDKVIWLGQNNQSEPIIVYTTGGNAVLLGTDGIDYKLASAAHPERSYGFFVKFDGHLFYQLTLYDQADNFTVIYDFQTQMFFTLTDQSMNYHPAKKVVLFNGKHYFISINDGNLHEMSTDIYTYDGDEIPRVRICASTKMEDDSLFIVNSLSFTTEQGQRMPDAPKEKIIDGELVANHPRVDMSISIDGGYSFSSYDGMDFNPISKRQNRFEYLNMGAANDFRPQFRFFGFGRFVSKDGVVNVYQ